MKKALLFFALGLFVLFIFTVIGFKLIDWDDWIDSTNILKCDRIHGEYGHSGKHALVSTLVGLAYIFSLIGALALTAARVFDDEKEPI